MSNEQNAIQELLDLVIRIRSECVPGVAGYDKIIRMIDEVCHEYC